MLLRTYTGNRSHLGLEIVSLGAKTKVIFNLTVTILVTLILLCVAHEAFTRTKERMLESTN